MVEQKTTAAQAGALRPYHSNGKARCDRRIDCIAASLVDLRCRAGSFGRIGGDGKLSALRGIVVPVAIVLWENKISGGVSLAVDFDVRRLTCAKCQNKRGGKEAKAKHAETSAWCDSLTSTKAFRGKVIDQLPIMYVMSHRCRRAAARIHTQVSQKA